MEVPIPVLEAVSVRKEKEPSAVAADIEKEESSPSSVLEAVVTESIAKPLAPVFETMVTDQIEPLTPVSRTEIIHKHVEHRLQLLNLFLRCLRAYEHVETTGSYASRAFLVHIPEVPTSIMSSDNRLIGDGRGYLSFRRPDLKA